MNLSLWIMGIMLMLMKSWSDNLSYLMFLGVSLVWLILNIIKNFFKISFLLINFMWLIMVLFFFSNMLWVFYIFFEINMIPMILILMGWGSNMARMNASIYMVLYTALFSLPVIFILLNNLKYLTIMSFSTNNYYMNSLSKLILSMMFMVKIPVFGLHYWLPKAHVEASTIGSMVLASGLLKMGGLGFIKIIVWTYFYMNNSWFIIGGFISSWYCCLQSDQKKMIALSSVSHMSFSTASVMSLMMMGHSSSVLYGFTHSITSSLLFFNSGVVSFLSKTRLMLYLPKITYTILLLLVFSIMLNLGVPPSISFLSELFSITSVFSESYLKMLVIFVMMLASLMFSLLYIMNLFQSINNSSYNFNNTMILVFFSHLIFMCVWFSKYLVN